MSHEIPLSYMDLINRPGFKLDDNLGQQKRPMDSTTKRHDRCMPMALYISCGYYIFPVLSFGTLKRQGAVTILYASVSVTFNWKLLNRSLWSTWFSVCWPGLRPAPSVGMHPSRRQIWSSPSLNQRLCLNRASRRLDWTGGEEYFIATPGHMVFFT